MTFGRTNMIGRFIVDIDGCLKSTNSPTLSAQDVLALQGSDLPAMVTYEVYDAFVPLGSADRVTLSADTVAFFRINEMTAPFRLRESMTRVPIAFPKAA